MSSPIERPGTRLRAALLTGVPFAIFKMGGGLAAAEDVGEVVGALVVAWGALDAALNLAAVAWPRRVSYCLLSNVGRQIDRRWPRPGHEQLLLAIDTLLAFLIVSTMIWFHRIGRLPSPLVHVWNVAVIANILAVGAERVWRSWQERGPGSPGRRVSDGARNG